MFDFREAMEEVRYNVIRRRSNKSGKVWHLQYQIAWIMSTATTGKSTECLSIYKRV